MDGRRRRRARRTAGGTPLIVVCSPHCGLDPETNSGGERYEVDLLTRLPAQQKILLAHGKPHPASLGRAVTRFPVARGLHWTIAPFVVPRALRHLHPFDVLRVHSLKFMGPACLIAKRRYGWSVPIVAHHHHLDAGPWPVERQVVRLVDRVIVGSEFARRQMAAEGFRTDHVRVVPYGIDRRFTPRQVPHDGKVRVLFLGGLKPRKNLGLLLDVWRAVERPSASLVIAGDGPDRAMLEAQGFSCSGYIPEADKPAWYQRADIFVFPSSMEGFGLAVGEAMSSGLPVVTSDAGSLPELVGDAGFVCRTKDDYVRALRLLIDHAPVRRLFGEAARERIDRHFRWERCVRGTMAVYTELVG